MDSPAVLRASTAFTRVVRASVVVCAVGGPSDVIVIAAGKVAVTTLPLLLVFSTIAADPGVDPVF